jgi:hypothetical protein
LESDGASASEFQQSYPSSSCSRVARVYIDRVPPH